MERKFTHMPSSVMSVVLDLVVFRNFFQVVLKEENSFELWMLVGTAEIRELKEMHLFYLFGDYLNL
jgi:hypothetical protein